MPTQDLPMKQPSHGLNTSLFDGVNGGGKWCVLKLLQLSTVANTAHQFVTAPCAMLGFAGGVLYFGTQETDPLKPIFVGFIGGNSVRMLTIDLGY